MVFGGQKYARKTLFVFIVLFVAWLGFAHKPERVQHELYIAKPIEKPIHQAVDTPPDEIDLIYPIDDSSALIDFQNPLNFKNSVVYDPITGKYVFRNTIGDSLDYVPPTYMTAEEYQQWQFEQSLRNYWRDKAVTQTQQSRVEVPELTVGGSKFRDIFGSNKIDIRPNGSAELRFGVKSSYTENPAIPEKQRRLTTFDFNEQIQLNVQGYVGDKLQTNISYNTQSTFDFENQIKLDYTGDEDEIIQRLEAGNVSLPLESSLITGSQSLFGVKSELKFGRTTVTSIVSQQKGERKEIEVAGGAQVTDFDIKADNYEANKHYFLNHYHHGHYDEAMATLPIVSSSVQITRIEVWVTNRVNQTEDTRNILAFTDLGEAKKGKLQVPQVYGPMPGINYGKIGDSIPDNDANGLYNYIKENPKVRNFSAAAQALSSTPFGSFNQAIDYEKLENARMLTSQEYTYNSQLGFISLNQSLNQDEVLAVAYQYTYRGEVYQVGEFSTDGSSGQQSLYLKLLKPTLTNPKNKLWDLMMKNVYSLSAYQISPQEFRLDVWYNTPKKNIDVNVIPLPGVDKIPLVQLVGLDRLNNQQGPTKDGVFDFIPININGNVMTGGGTINPQNGRIYFTTVEPFGDYLRSQLSANGLNTNVVNTVAFDQLYDSTKIVAQQVPELNRFKLKGSYQSSSGSEISLNAFNIPQGSVIVTAGGVQLTENVDYTVDYSFGKVKILNEGILNSGTPIKISLESQSLFSIVNKSFLGTHVDYRINKDMNIGATALRLSERPLTQKVNIGDEPIKNTIVGANWSFRKEAPFLTRLVDKLPIIETKAPSYIQVTGEYAYLIPGQNRFIQGLSYLDDFEGSQTTIDLRSAFQWKLASIPQGQPTLFPEAAFKSDLQSGFNRARMAWYTIDPLFFRDNNLTPDHWAGSDAQNDHRMREVLTDEVFPNRQLPTGTPPNIAVLDLTYFPDERGPYNFETSGSSTSVGLEDDGRLAAPETRWAGIMRPLTTNDFEAANIEFIQFWVMDPFSEEVNNGSNEDSKNTTGGVLYFNLGNISEDILNDGSKSFENGIPVDGDFDEQKLKETVWGWIPTTQAIVNTFDNDPDSRANQDVGLDGLDDDNERQFYSDYVEWVENSTLSEEAKQQILNDPANDNYNYYRDDNYDAQELDVIQRYKRYNDVQGNSPTTEMSAQLNEQGYPTSATQSPDVEDINQDNSLNESESYYQYRVDLRPQNMQVGNGFITDRVLGRDPDTDKEVYWYQYKIPVRTQQKQAINGIQDFRSIRFFRMFLKEFDEEVTLRFARLELVRGEWRRYDRSLEAFSEGLADDNNFDTSFDIGAVNVEENASKEPIGYVVPPDIQREQNFQSQNLVQLNEQAMTLNVCNLKDGDARAAFRNVDFDVLSYKKIRMFVHGEYVLEDQPVGDNEVTVFVRIGSDFENNYYEYEMPVKMTKWDATGERNVWPIENDMVIDLDTLRAIKLDRNSRGESEFRRYSVQDPANPSNQIHIIGSPNLQDLKTIMIGVRNPKKGSSENIWGDTDDGSEKCVEIWVNELRMTDFDNFGGWATQGRVNANLADFGQVALAGSYSTPGFGSIDKKLSERQRETQKNLDASTTLQMGQFFGQKLGVQLPVFLGFSRSVIDPMFDPLNPDILFEESLETLDPEQQQERKEFAQDFTERRSFNLSNISVQPNFGGSNKKPRLWSIKNFSLSYAYSEIFKRNQNYVNNLQISQQAGFNYMYSGRPKLWEPFSNVKLFKKSKFFKPLEEFNLYLGPKSIAHNSSLVRQYQESKIRANFGAEIDPLYFKNFNWNRSYNFKYDLTKALAFDFTANNVAYIAEQEGQTRKGELFEDTLMVNNLKTFGENLNYGHTSNLSYTLPFNKFPLTDWINSTVRYSGAYDWTRGPIALDDAEGNSQLGNTIQNSRNIMVNGTFNFVTLYNKVPYFKKINQKHSSSGSRGRLSGVKPPNQKKDSTDKEEKEGFPFLEHTVRLFMAIKTVSVNYTTNDGIFLPGFVPKTEYLGMSTIYDFAPGYKFVTGGFQQRDVWGNPTKGIENNFPVFVAQNGWFINQENSELLNSQYTSNHRKTFGAKATIEPFNGLRIELSADQNRSENLTQNFSIEGFGHNIRYNPYDSILNGTYSVSVISWKTAFESELEAFGSDLFQDLRDNRSEVSQVLAEQNENSTPGGVYAEGYGESNQDVLMGSFLTTYLGRNPNSKNINPFAMTPLPNWSIRFDGLSKIKKLKEIFKSITFSHAYRSTFTIANYTTNLEATTTGDSQNNLASKDLNGNFIPIRQISSINIAEQISPLIGVDATLQNSFIAKVEIKRERNLSLSLTNSQLTEIKSNEIVVGSGYRFEDVELPIEIGGKRPVSNLNLRADISYRDNKTIIRKILEDQNLPTSGQKVVSIKVSADYQIGPSLTVRFYYDQVITDPVIQTSFRTSRINSGLALRFTLAQ